MNKILKNIRAKRFAINRPGDVNLILEMPTGERVKLEVSNSSIAGVGGIVREAPENVEFTVGIIIPESKLVWPDQEMSLGRLVLKHIDKQESGTHLGISCIDTKVPLMGGLSKYFAGLARDGESPLEYELSARKLNIATFLETDHEHADLFEKCRQYQILRKDSAKNPLFQFYSVRHDSIGPRINLRLPSSRKRTPVISFASYDYLGYGVDPEVQEAAKQAIDRYGLSPGGSLTLSGKTSIHEELEEVLARNLGKEACYLYNSGYSANVGTITSLLGIRDLVLADISAHASIHDAVTATKSKARFFRHNNLRHLETLLGDLRADHAGSLIISEGLFSMDGDVPDLEGLAKVARKFESRLFVDECHSFGIVGPNGLGASERAGVLDEVDIFMGTLSKGLGAGGGFVVGDRALITWLESFARAGIFSVALFPAAAAAALCAFKKSLNDATPRQRLHANIAAFREGLARLGVHVESDEQSPIIPIVIGDEAKLGIINSTLLERGIFANPVIFPAVPVHSCRLRFSLTAQHSLSDVALAVAALEIGFKKADFTSAPEQLKAG